MGKLLSKQKKEGSGGRKFYQFWAKDPQPARASTKVTVVAPAKSPIGWTDVPLQVPDIPESVQRDIISEVPVPPPRKNRGKISLVHNFTNLGAAKEAKPPRALPQVPVEEAIIVPKKEPIHICDGTHHHVTNIANGKVIHDTHIAPKRNKIQPKHEKSIRPKNMSTVSLPNYEELSSKSRNSKAVIGKNAPVNKKPTRNISVTSLPTDDKVFLSSTTAARLENYMLRCKSFGSLPPKELFEKMQNQMNFENDSDDSWEGIEDWDLEIIEPNAVRQSPVVPKCRLPAPTLSPSAGSNSDHRLPTTIEEVDEVTKIKLPNPAPEIITTSTFHVPSPATVSTSKSDSISGTFSTPTSSYSNIPVAELQDMQDGPVNKGIITLKKREGRRESIDDFFDSKAENPIVNPVAAKIKKENFLGRRGSDGFFGYDNKYPLQSEEGNAFKKDKFFTNALLQSETQHSGNDSLKLRRKSAGAALHRIESNDGDDDETRERIKTVMKTFDPDEDLLDTFHKFYQKNETSGSKTETNPKCSENTTLSSNSESISSFENVISIEDQLSKVDKKDENFEIISIQTPSHEKLNESRLSAKEKFMNMPLPSSNKDKEKSEMQDKSHPGIVEHSSLLRFIQENAIESEPSQAKNTSESFVEVKLPEPLLSGLKSVEEKSKPKW